MDINYQKSLDNVIASLGGARPRLLLHSCCGPCSSYVLEYLHDYFDLTVLYFNPNIQPRAEYEKRKSEQLRLIAEAYDDVAVMDCEYAPESFESAAAGLEREPEGGARCVKCFELRLNETARAAAAGGFDWFGTTLTVSPHKNARLINDIGAEAARRYGVAWLPSDFKKRDGYRRSIELSKRYGLYRQSYCGCAYGRRGEA